MKRQALIFATFLLLGAHGADPVRVTPVDPLTIADDDFARHRDPAVWAGLTVTGIDFAEERAAWRLYRIADPARPTGPLWVVPHDDENAGFDAALVALRRYGGTLMLVDSDGRRRNRAVAFGPTIDPNRTFHDGLPRYAAQMLAAVNAGAWPIIALHTNSPGYDGARATCGDRGGDAAGEGVISIRFCNATLTPVASRARAWPFDDDDSVAFATYTATRTPEDAFCRNEMVGDDWNVVQERVVNSDGSLSNYAVLHGLDYLNFEVRETGTKPVALARARDRLLWMIDRALALCGSKRPPRPVRVQFR
ncbi:hypothetical protein SAMN06297144_2162 [Sphingomonas guangdongensis]|uniref:Uncharacterized protein n=1 Tax=Sphingomonas guangdongensis TaxID=1141890 RepID=A0A285R3V9_9SPHN|nr:hypothetical protein [Sphingomonas guangdongensis]SOB87042.1 hypothetical protein SAMN06297144_2162 [Sphingomonas guangdongensis]